jgi:hypothetical protein
MLNTRFTLYPSHRFASPKRLSSATVAPDSTNPHGQSSTRGIRQRIVRLSGGRILAALVVLLALTTAPAFAQLNWEGQTGGFITPFAYTSPSPSTGFGRPQVAFHYFNAGPVIGNLFQTSVTEGVFKHVEFGYTRALSSEGNTPGLSPLFTGGFNIFHAKVNVLEENAFKTKYLPAISVGFVARTQVERVGGVLDSKSTWNGDFYVVGTKTITQIKVLPIVLNAGFKETNASVFGIAGNSPAWVGRFFGTGAIVVKGPKKSAFIFGSEIVQQPRYIEGLQGPTIPTTVTYVFRFLPGLEKAKLNFDFGVAQAVGVISPGVNIQARHQVATGISYQF